VMVFTTRTQGPGRVAPAPPVLSAIDMPTTKGMNGYYAGKRAPLEPDFFGQQWWKTANMAYRELQTYRRRRFHCELRFGIMIG
jgi:hypothetical protein